MAEIKNLIPGEQLKTSLLNQLTAHKPHPLYINYDDDFDALMLSVVPFDIETILYYVDSHVALLFTPDNLEVVGLQIEAFQRVFLPQHASVKQVWKLSDSGERLKDYGEMILEIEHMKPAVAREVVKATEPVLGKQGVELVAAFA